MAYYGPDYSKTIEKLVLKALVGGPRPILSLVAMVDASESAVRRVVASMVETGTLKDCGSASRFGYAMRSGAVKAYGLPDDAPDGPEDLAEIEAAQLRPRSKSGSGVIAPPPYATGYRWGNVR